MLNRIITKIATSLIRPRFNKKAAQVRSLLPSTNFDSASNLIILSMVQKKDVDMYLLALKSFLSYVTPQRIVVVADPSIDQESEDILNTHIANLEIRRAEEFRYPETPTGGCWERLNAIAEYNLDNYVIQLDADTITISEPTEVKDCVKNQISFTLGTFQGQKLVSLAEAAKFAKSHMKSERSHIQLESEYLLDKLDLSQRYYVRGCAGFAGFAPNAMSKQLVAETSMKFYTKLKSRWEEWGSEQFMSNLLVSNGANVCVLSIDRYLTPLSAKFEDKAFLHLIGSMRFKNTIYLKAITQFINKNS